MAVMFIWSVEDFSQLLLHAIDESLKHRLITLEGKIMAQLDELEASVKRNTDVTASAVTLIEGIAARITAAGNDPAKLKALSDELTSDSDTLAAAVAANTPASEPPPA